MSTLMVILEYRIGRLVYKVSEFAFRVLSIGSRDERGERMKAIKAALQSLLYAVLIVGFHLILIYFLDIRIKGWETELIKGLIKVYFLPLLLCYINSLMIIRSKKVKYHVTWFLASMIPSSLLLMFFKSIQDTGEMEHHQFVSIELFPKYSLEMFTFLPGGLLIIQLLFTLYFLIKIRMEAKR